MSWLCPLSFKIPEVSAFSLTYSVRIMENALCLITLTTDYIFTLPGQRKTEIL